MTSLFAAGVGLMAGAHTDLVILFGTTYAVERGMAEVYKCPPCPLCSLW
jgi:hypothetical protein